MNASKKYEVIIVGGGPAGSSCATVLAQAGIRVGLFEKEKFPRNKICGETVNPKCWELFDILGVSPAILSASPCTIDEVRITNSKGFCVGARISKNSRPFFSIKRSTLDHLLLENAGNSGAHVQEERRVIDLCWNAEWQVTARSPHTGEIEHYFSRFLIGADGRNSLVAAKGLAIPASAAAKADAPRVGVQWHAPRQPQLGAALEMYLFAQGYFGIVNVDAQSANVALVTCGKLAQLAKQNFTRFLETTVFLNSAAARRFANLQSRGEVRTTFPIDPRVNPQKHASAYLIGDAWHTVEPFTGEGIYFAIRDGIIAATKILQRINRKAGIAPPKSTSRIWANRIFSPVLRKPDFSERCIRWAAQAPFTVRLGLGIILGSYHRFEISG